jgi:hypothetical protein
MWTMTKCQEILADASSRLRPAFGRVSVGERRDNIDVARHRET